MRCYIIYLVQVVCNATEYSCMTLYATTLNVIYIILASDVMYVIYIYIYIYICVYTLYVYIIYITSTVCGVYTTTFSVIYITYTTDVMYVICTYYVYIYTLHVYYIYIYTVDGGGYMWNNVQLAYKTLATDVL